MDDLGQNAALVALAFLQADVGTSEYEQELRSLGEELNLTRDVNFNEPWIDSVEDGDLESDGHLPSSITAALNDIQPVVQLPWPGE